MPLRERARSERTTAGPARRAAAPAPAGAAALPRVAGPALSPDDALGLQSALGNRQASRLLRPPGGALQRYIRYTADDQQASRAADGWQNPHGAAMRVAEDFSIALSEGDRSPHAWATREHIERANALLASQGAPAFLRRGAELDGHHPGQIGSAEPLYAIEPRSSNSWLSDPLKLEKECGVACRTLQGLDEDRTFKALARGPTGNERATTPLKYGEFARGSHIEIKLPKQQRDEYEEVEPERVMSDDEQPRQIQVERPAPSSPRQREGLSDEQEPEETFTWHWPGQASPKRRGSPFFGQEEQEQPFTFRLPSSPSKDEDKGELTRSDDEEEPERPFTFTFPGSKSTIEAESSTRSPAYERAEEPVKPLNLGFPTSASLMEAEYTTHSPHSPAELSESSGETPTELSKKRKPRQVVEVYGKQKHLKKKERRQRPAVLATSPTASPRHEEPSPIENITLPVEEQREQTELMLPGFTLDPAPEQPQPEVRETVAQDEQSEGEYIEISPHSKIFSAKKQHMRTTPERFSEDLLAQAMSDLTGKTPTSRTEVIAWYESLTDKSAVDQAYGLNEYAVPRPGEGLAITSERQVPGFVKDSSVKGAFNFHFGTAIIVSGADYLTLENDSGRDNPRDYYFNLFGPASKQQSFHQEYGQTGKFGNKYTTMLVVPGDREIKAGLESGATVLLQPGTRVEVVEQGEQESIVSILSGVYSGQRARVGTAFITSGDKLALPQRD